MVFKVEEHEGDTNHDLVCDTPDKHTAVVLLLCSMKEGSTLAYSHGYYSRRGECKYAKNITQLLCVLQNAQVLRL
jgi:ketol-acid reductoisomerase